MVKEHFLFLKSKRKLKDIKQAYRNNKWCSLFAVELEGREWIIITWTLYLFSIHVMLSAGIRLESIRRQSRKYDNQLLLLLFLWGKQSQHFNILLSQACLKYKKKQLTEWQKMFSLKFTRSEHFSLNHWVSIPFAINTSCDKKKSRASSSHLTVPKVFCLSLGWN